MTRIAVFTHFNSDGVPPQALLIQRMLVSEGYDTVLIGKGKTGLGRLFDVAWRGMYWIARSDVALIDVFGRRAFVDEALAILYGKLFGRRVVAIVRGGWLADFAGQWPRFSRWVLRQPVIRLAPHKFLVERLGALGIVVDAIIPNIIELEAYRYIERAKVRPRFLYLRGTHALYDPETCLRAFALIQQRYPEASLTMAAAGSLDACRGLASQLGLRNVAFPGRVPKADVPRLADAHDIYFQANRVENMPVTILEMWACGLPVVGTTAGGTPYLVRDGEDGLLVPPGVPTALAAACCRLLDDPELAMRLARAGRARVEEFTWPEVRQRWRAFLTPATTAAGRCEVT